MESSRSRRQLYEYSRDDMHATACWLAQNNQCLPHFHSSIELVYVRSGTLYAILDGQGVTVPAGHVLIVSGYMVHTYQSRCENDDLIVIIPLSFVPSLQKTLRGCIFAKPLCNVQADEKICALLKLFCSGWSSYSTETQKGLSYALLGMLITRVGLIPVSKDARKDLMKDVLIYLQNNYQHPLRMETLAQQFGYSKSRFSHLFNETLGCPPGTFINALRCQHASRAMLESDQTLLEIALNAGFECPRTFYRAFKQYYGLTPTQYIRAHSQPSRP